MRTFRDLDGGRSGPHAPCDLERREPSQEGLEESRVSEGVDEGELDRLYRAAPEDFVAEREALARRLKQDGNTEAAASVRSLVKPTLPVWLVNRLARERKPKVRELVKAGERLREAHAGGDLSAFRDATRREREAVANLVDEARTLARGEDRRVSEAMLERVASTLHAAAADEEARFRLAGVRGTDFRCLPCLLSLRPEGLLDGRVHFATEQRRPLRTAADAGRGDVCAGDVRRITEWCRYGESMKAVTDVTIVTAVKTTKEVSVQANL